MPVRIAVPRTEPQTIPSSQTLHNQQLHSQPVDGNGSNGLGTSATTVAAHRDDSITYDIRTGKPIKSDMPHNSTTIATTTTTAAAASVKPVSGITFIHSMIYVILIHYN
jgi:hypothetical protein